MRDALWPRLFSQKSVWAVQCKNRATKKSKSNDKEGKRTTNQKIGRQRRAVGPDHIPRKLMLIVQLSTSQFTRKKIGPWIFFWAWRGWGARLAVFLSCNRCRLLNHKWLPKWTRKKAAFQVGIVARVESQSPTQTRDSPPPGVHLLVFFIRSANHCSRIIFRSLHKFWAIITKECGFPGKVGKVARSFKHCTKIRVSLFTCLFE